MVGGTITTLTVGRSDMWEYRTNTMAYSIGAQQSTEITKQCVEQGDRRTVFKKGTRHSYSVKAVQIRIFHADNVAGRSISDMLCAYDSVVLITTIRITHDHREGR